MEDNVKQRVVGAVVLASAAVIFFPSLFDEPDNRYIGGQSQIPPAPVIEPQFIPEPVRPDNIEPAKAPEAMYQLVDEPAPQPTPEAKPPADPTPVSAPQSAPERPGLNDQKVLKAWVLQVASFTDQRKAEDLRDRLIKAGHPSYVCPLVNSKGQQVVRVFVGPKADKAAMIKLKAELDASLKVSALLLEFKP